MKKKKVFEYMRVVDNAEEGGSHKIANIKSEKNFSQCYGVLSIQNTTPITIIYRSRKFASIFYYRTDRENSLLGKFLSDFVVAAGQT